MIIRTRYRKTSIGLCLAVLMALAMGWKYWELRFALSFVPDALAVSTVSYSKEESWGFGPGGNETGLRLYPLGAQLSKTISEQGVAYFRTMPPNANQAERRWRGAYDQWQPTPITATEGQPGPFSLEAYKSQYGFDIDIDPAISKQVNGIVQSPGAYYARGRIGIIVVSPQQRLVIYMYNG